MVERTQAGFEEFEGVIKNIEKVPSQLADSNSSEQYHMEIEPADIEIKGKTGMMHEWIGIPRTATETSVPEGSVLDRYLAEIEMIIREAKTVAKVDEAFNLLVGKKCLFKKIKLGRSFQGHEAKEYWVPRQVLA